MNPSPAPWLRAPGALAAVALVVALAAAPARTAPADRKDLVLRGFATRDDGRPAAGAFVSVSGGVEAAAVASGEGRFTVVVPLGTVAARGTSPLDLRVEVRDGRRRLRAEGGPERLELTIRSTPGPGGAARMVASSNLPALAEALNPQLAIEGDGMAFGEVRFGRRARPASPGVAPPDSTPPPIARPPASPAAARTGPASAPGADPARGGRDTTAAAAAAPRPAPAPSPAGVAPGLAAERDRVRAADAEAKRRRDAERRAAERLRAARRDSARAALRVRDSLRHVALVEERLRAAEERDRQRQAAAPRPPLDPRPPVGGRPAGGPAPRGGSDVAGAGGDCACRIAGTVEVWSDAPLPEPLPVTISVRGVPGLRAEARLFMGSPREFVLDRVPCGPRALDVRAASPRRWVVADPAVTDSVDCAAGTLRQPRIRLIAR